MVRLFWCSRPENFQNFRNVLKGSPKFPTGNMFTFAIFTSSKPLLQFWCVSRVIYEGLRKCYTPILNGIFSLGIFACHLHKPSSNWFSQAKGFAYIVTERAGSHIMASLWKMIFARGLTLSVFGKWSSRHCFIVCQINISSLRTF